MGRDNIINNTYTNRFGEVYQVIEYVETVKRQSRYNVRFLETGYEVLAYSTNIKKGIVIDRSKKDALCKYKIGQTITNKNGVAAEILDMNILQEDTGSRTQLKIKFIDSGYITFCTPDNFIRCKTKDYLAPTVLGVGMLGYVENIEGRLRDMKEYRIWEGMIHRCYQQDYENKNKSYEQAEVCDRWKRFDYFLEDIVHIEGYDHWKEYHEKHPNQKNTYEFDKDTKVLENKIYSPETCRFIHKTYNAGFTSWATLDTKLKIIKRMESDNSEKTTNERCFS